MHKYKPELSSFIAQGEQIVGTTKGNSSLLILLECLIINMLQEIQRLVEFMLLFLGLSCVHLSALIAET